MSILVIDDEETIRKSFQLALEFKGVRVDTAESGEQGVEFHQQMKYDLIFLDLKMPGMNGVETLKKIRKLTPNVPVYIVTAFHKEFFDDLKELLDAGIGFEIVHKPIGGPEIVNIVQSVMRQPTASV